MLRTISRRHRLLVVLVVAVALGAGTYAFTATNTVPATTESTLSRPGKRPIHISIASIERRASPE